MSDYDREQRTAYLNGIWNYWLKEMAEGRKVKPEALNQLANDSIMALSDAKDYVTAKLVDKILFPEELKAEIKNRLKIDKDDDINQLTLSDMLNVKSKDKKDGEKMARRLPSTMLTVASLTARQQTCFRVAAIASWVRQLQRACVNWQTMTT